MHPDLLPAVSERRALISDLLGLAAAVQAERWDAPTENPGWSCRDLLAHLASGDWVMQRTVRDALAGRDLGWWRPGGFDLDGVNADRITAARGKAVEEVLADLRRQQTQSLALWELLDARALETIMARWDGGYQTLLDYLLAFPGHDRSHIGQLRTALAAGRDA